jgi:hypothetical protein
MTRAAARSAGRRLLLGGLAVAAAYQVSRPFRLPPDGPLARMLLEGFHAPEEGYRWSRDRATLVVPDPGPGRWRVRAEVSAWRPRGQPPPLLALSAGPARVSARPGPRPQWIPLEAEAAGAWNGDLTLNLESETFRPGPGDARLLGVRVHGLTVEPLGPTLACRWPPLNQVACGALLLLLAGALAGERRRVIAEALAGTTLLLAFVFARPWAATLSWRLAVIALVIALILRLAPALASVVREVAAEAVRALLRGARGLAAWPSLALVAAGMAGLVLAQRAQPALDIDLGSGREAALARGFGAFDGAEGVTFRQPLRGAELDLRDFGGGAPWTVALTASLAAPARVLPLLTAGAATLEAEVDGRWSTRSVQAPSPWGWRPGLRLTFPGAAEGIPLRLDRVSVERAGSRPSPRLGLALVAAALLVVGGLLATGASVFVSYVAGAVVLGAELLAVARDPMVSVPFASRFLLICALGALAAALGASLRTWQSRRGREAPPVAVVAAVALGFTAWLAASAFPLYRGGHFVFHSSIAEEIWKGRFLHYYLPYPGSMLSRQEQWGNIIVPHSCLYHTLVSPLAALPRASFFFVEKALLAALLGSMAVMAALTARRLRDGSAGAFAAAAFVTLVPPFQIVGLGHLMTLFGCWAASLALVFLLHRFERLPQRATWITACALLTLCFLSYTASLLFTSLVLAASVALLHARAPRGARALAGAGLAAAALAFVLYYVNWAWPFLTQSLPQILSGSASRDAAADGGGAAGALANRLALQPHKLAYTFGTAVVPLAGLAGVAWAARARRPEGVIAACWVAVLPLVSVADLFFNFLRKHHYYTMVPLAAGLGLLLAALSEKGKAGRVAAVLALLAAAVLSGRMALDVALGKIP